MIRRISLTFFILILLCNLKANASGNIYNSDIRSLQSDIAKVTFTFDESISYKEVVISVYKNFFLRRYGFPEFKIERGPSERTFTIELNSTMLPGYLKVNGLGKPNPINGFYYLVAGDDITFQVGKEVKVSGKGCEKILAQLKVDSIQLRFSSNNVDYYYNLLKNDSIVNDVIERKFRVLSKYEHILSEQARKAIHDDIIVDSKYSLVKSLRIIHDISADSNVKRSIHRFFIDSINKVAIGFDSNSISYDSRGVTDYLLMMIKGYYAFNLSKDGITLHKVNFREVYNWIILKYSGRLREKLLIAAIYDLLRNTDDKRAYLDSIGMFITSPDLRATYADYLSKNQDGKPFYNFKLMDTKGNHWSNSDLSGKVLILDFWYTGCSGCAGLKKAMEPFVEKYIHNKSIKFLSISIDKDFKKWKQSVTSNIYSDSRMLNLYTNGFGEKHPLILEYGIDSYPRIMVVGKDGFIINSNAPKPNSDNAILEFSIFLDSLL